ncbi:MAG: hypothetical protein ACI39Q_09275 [Wujia sp.]
MGKKKKNGRAGRKETAARNERREQQMAKSGGKNQDNTQEKKDEAVITRQSEQLSMYTATAMLEALVAAASVMLAMVVWASLVYYLLEAVLGKVYGEENLTMTEILYFEGAIQDKAEMLMLIAAILLVAVTVMAIIIVVRAINASKKPLLVIYILSFICSVAALVLFICSGNGIVHELDTNEYLRTLTRTPCFNVYVGCFVALIVNVVGTLVNIIAGATGLGKWKKNGRTY